MAPHTVASDVFSVIGDESRRRILEVLATREATVSELVALLDRPQPQVSKHLGVLREAGAVQCRPDGRARIYRLDPAALAPLARWLDRLTTQVNERYDRLDTYLDELQHPERDEREEGAR
jgi:DNA-binding transcriptional ArsR family regulator